MLIDFSVLKTIDFTNKDNLIFLSIFLILILIVFFILFEIIAGIVRFFRRLFIKIFGAEAKKAKLNQKGTEWLHQAQQNKEPEEAGTTPKQKVFGSEFMSKPVSEEKAPEKSFKQTDNEKGKNSIDSSLEKLKGGDSLNLVDQQGGAMQNVSLGSAIKIPTSTHPLNSNMQPVEFSASQNKENNTGDSYKELPHKNETADSSIFGGKTEISRENLEEEMKSNTKVWQASRQEGLDLNPIERAKLVKEVFSRDLGENISRTDLKQGIRRLNEKLLGAKSQTEHAKIRKEIKFFKKIGGIK